MIDSDDDGFVLVWPRPRGDDEDTEKLPVVKPSDVKEFCTQCFLNRKRVDYGFSSRKPFWECPGCHDVIEED